MNNITWLASYPKSGNTWFRYFLLNLLADSQKPLDINQMGEIPVASSRGLFDEAVGIDSSDLSHDEIDRLRPEVYRFLSSKATGPRYFKIHDAYTCHDDGTPLIPPEATCNVIYIIRNPLDVAVSFANHSGISYDCSIEQMNDETFCFSKTIRRLENQLRQKLLSWSGHVRSWIEAKDIDLLVLRYEDMKQKPIATFTGAVSFLGLNKTPEQINKALEFSRFDQLQGQEQENGFNEKPPGCHSFFNKGETGIGRKVLTLEQVNNIIAAHRTTMEQFGYL